MWNTVPGPSRVKGIEVPATNMSRYVLLWFLGLYLRLGILIVPPLIPRLESILGFSSSQSAVLTSLPMLLIGVGALIGGWFIARLGVVGTLVLGLGVMAAGSALRGITAGFSLFVFATVVMGLGVAFMQTGLPALTRSWLPDNVGRAAAVYTNGLLTGELLAAGLTGSLVTFVLGDAWLLAFVVWVLPVPVLMAVVWWRAVIARPVAPAPASSVPLSPDWRDPLLWRVAVVLAGAGTLYFCGNIFLPPILAASDRLYLLDASLAALNGIQILSSGLLIAYADRLLHRRWPLYAATVIALLLIPALLWLPGTGVIWAAGLFGAVTSALLILGLALPAWLVPAEEVSRMAAGVLFIGYTLVFVVPTVGGWLTDVTGSLALGFLPVVLFGVAVLAAIGGIRQRGPAANHVAGT